MPKKINFQLTEAGLREIAEAIKHDKRPEVRQRAMGLRLLHERKPAKAVAEFLSVSQPTVYDWRHRWQREGIEGLTNLPKSARPVKASPEYVELLEEVVDQDPQALGYAFSIWTTERLRLQLKAKSGIELKPTQFRALLKEHDFVYLSPSEARLDQSTRRGRSSGGRRMAAGAKKSAEAGEIDLFFVDESTLGWLLFLVACWMKRGCQKRIPTPGQPQWRHLFGAYNWVTDEVIYQVAEKRNSESFIAFLEHLLQQHTGERPLILVLDNGSIHHSLASQAAFAVLEDRLLPVFLPRYCSQLNPIERFWKYLKSTACASKLFANIEAVVTSVEQLLRQQNDSSSPSRFMLLKCFPQTT